MDSLRNGDQAEVPVDVTVDVGHTRVMNDGSDFASQAARRVRASLASEAFSFEARRTPRNTNIAIRQEAVPLLVTIFEIHALPGRRFIFERTAQPLGEEPLESADEAVEAFAERYVIHLRESIETTDLEHVPDGSDVVLP